MLDELLDGTPWSDKATDPSPTGPSAMPFDDSGDDAYPDILTPQTIGQPLRTWESIRANNDHTSIRFDDKTGTLTMRSATIPRFEEMQQTLHDCRQRYGADAVTFVRVQFRRGEFSDRNGIAALLRKGFRQLDGLPGLAVFEKDLSLRAPKRKRVVEVKKPETPEPVPELQFSMSLEEMQTKQRELNELRAHIQKLQGQRASEGIS